METYRLPPPEPVLLRYLVANILILAVFIFVFPDNWLIVGAIGSLPGLALLLAERYTSSRRDILCIATDGRHLILTHPPFFGRSPRSTQHDLRDFHAAASYQSREAPAYCTALLPGRATSLPLPLLTETLPDLRSRKAVPPDILARAQDLRAWLTEHAGLDNLGALGICRTVEVHLAANKAQRP